MFVTAVYANIFGFKPTCGHWNCIFTWIKKKYVFYFFLSSQDLLPFFEYKLPAKLKVIKGTKISKLLS